MNSTHFDAINHIIHEDSANANPGNTNATSAGVLFPSMIKAGEDTTTAASEMTANRKRPFSTFSASSTDDMVLSPRGMDMSFFLATLKKDGNKAHRCLSDDDVTAPRREQEVSTTQKSSAAPSTRSRDKISLVLCRPTSLAHEDDKDNLNEYHQYIRSDILEIVVVEGDGNIENSSVGSNETLLDATVVTNYDGDSSSASTTSTSNFHSFDEDDDSTIDGQSVSAVRAIANPPSRIKTPYRATVSGRGSRPPTKPILYAGRVGLRCRFCARRGNAQVSKKPCVYPNSLGNIYKQVCEWSRLHLETCPSLPKKVRQEYKKLKKEDKTRGQRRYWETSAAKIGLQNAVDEWGIVFSD